MAAAIAERAGTSSIRAMGGMAAQMGRGAIFWILAALAAGASTVDGLVERLYADTPPALRPMAARNVRAHLERLAELGRVRVEDGRWGTAP